MISSERLHSARFGGVAKAGKAQPHLEIGGVWQLFAVVTNPLLCGGPNDDGVKINEDLGGIGPSGATEPFQECLSLYEPPLLCLTVMLLHGNCVGGPYRETAAKRHIHIRKSLHKRYRAR